MSFKTFKGATSGLDRIYFSPKEDYSRWLCKRVGADSKSKLYTHGNLSSSDSLFKKTKPIIAPSIFSRW